MARVFSFGNPARRRDARAGVEHVLTQRALHRVLAFIGHDIDDVVNDPIVKNKVIGYYKLHKWVWRACEVSDLERQWNGR